MLDDDDVVISTYQRHVYIFPNERFSFTRSKGIIVAVQHGTMHVNVYFFGMELGCHGAGKGGME
jgi:hypothetical protein